MRIRARTAIVLAVLTAFAVPAAPAHAAFPGQPNTVVFWSDRTLSSQLFTMGPNGKNEQPVGAGIDGFPGQLSPDGTRIAYVSNAGPGDGNEVWVVDTDGSNAMELTTTGQYIFDPSWNPAGTKILFSVWVPAASTLELFTVRASGGTPQRITHSSAVDEYSPVWSPDGKWIAFSGNNDKDPVFQYDIYRVRPDGSGRVRVTDSPDRYEASPDWSADGSRISYTVFVDGSERTDVMTIRPDGTGARNITKDFDLDVENATWLPNGRIVFDARPIAGDTEIWAISPDRTGLLQLTDNDDSDELSYVT